MAYDDDDNGDGLYQYVPADMLPMRSTYGGSRPGITLPSGQRIPAPPPSPDIPPYWLYKPPSGLDFLFRRTDVLAAGIGQTLVLEPASGVAVRSLPGWRGVVKSVVVFIDAPTTALDVNFALRFNQGPVIGWDQLGSFPRAANSISIEYTGTVQFGENVTVTVLATNNTALAWTVGAEVGGWQWPHADEVRVFGSLATP